MSPKHINHPVLGELQVLEDSQGVKTLHKTLLLNTNPIKYEAITSPNILGLKAITPKSSSTGNIEYEIQCEYYNMTLQEELQQRIQSNQKYTQQEILHFLQNISVAIAHLQEHKLVHGGIKCANILKVGQEYKLLHPILLRELKAPVIEKLPKISLHKNKTIITPDMLRAYHREVIDPVHEDHKDDVYALGLVVLDMMALHMEAPVPISKKLEQISFTYTPHLVRLVKKMLEDVLTLRIDPIACNLYVEKIYLKEKSKLVTKSSIIVPQKSEPINIPMSYQSSPRNHLYIEKNFKLEIPPASMNLNFGKNWLHDDLRGTQTKFGYDSQESNRPLESTSRNSLVKSRTNFKGHYRHNSAIDSIAPTNITSLSRLEEEELNNLRITPNLTANYESPCRVSDEENPRTRKSRLSINESLLFSGLPEQGVCAEFEDFETSRRDIFNHDFNGHIKNMTQSLALFLSKPSTPTRGNAGKNESTPEFKANADLHNLDIKSFLTPIRPGIETSRYSHGSTYHTTGRNSRLNRLNESSILHDHIYNTNNSRSNKKVIFGNNPERLDFQKNIEKLKAETEMAISNTLEPSSMRTQNHQDTLSSSQSRGKVLFRRRGPYADLKISTAKNSTTTDKKQPRSSLFCEGMCSKVCQNDAQSPTIYLDQNQAPHPEIRLTDSQEKLLNMIKQKVNKAAPNTVTFNSKSSPQLYQGELKSGKKHGYGALISEDGMIVFEGSWKNDQYHGEGTLLNHNPRDPLKGTFSTSEKKPIIPTRQAGDWIKYSGSFVEGKWEGFGQLFATNGDKYVGQFKNDKAYGKGDFISQDGKVCQGEWQDNFFVTIL